MITYELLQIICILSYLKPYNCLQERLTSVLNDLTMVDMPYKQQTQTAQIYEVIHVWNEYCTDICYYPFFVGSQGDYFKVNGEC